MFAGMRGQRDHWVDVLAGCEIAGGFHRSMLIYLFRPKTMS
jgi:hypothetical protein